MPTHGGLEVELHAFLTSALDVNERSASLARHFAPRGIAPDTHWTVRRMCPRAGLGTAEREKSRPISRECICNYVFIFVCYPGFRQSS
jgi:hypothetical protein